jgi:plasmid stabilization system protein ParE
MVASNEPQRYRIIAADSPANAATFGNRLLDQIDGLALFPHRTRMVRPHSRQRRHDVRTLPVQNYIVYFRVEERTQLVKVLRIQHGARRPPSGI